MSVRTRALMSLSAVFLAVLGVVGTFLPQELLAHAGVRTDGTPVLLIQLMGGLYLGFAMLNWMSRASRIGGIYARPLSMGNFLHFAAGGAALLKGAMAQSFPVDVVVLAMIYALVAAWFGVVLFTHPD